MESVVYSKKQLQPYLIQRFGSLTLFDSLQIIDADGIISPPYYSISAYEIAYGGDLEDGLKKEKKKNAFYSTILCT